MTRSICTIENCSAYVNARGLCGKHYRRWSLYGDPEAPSRNNLADLNAEQILRRKLRTDAPHFECWEWAGYINRSGYGQLSFKKETWLAHRLAYLTWIGPIPEGMFVCHSCDNRKCINPEHLWAGTNRDNVNDMLTKNRKERGEDLWNTVLTAEDVRAIRRSEESNVLLAARFKVDPSTISRIRAKTRWIYVE